MPNRWIIALKVLVHAACLLPLAWLLWGLLHQTLGPDPTHTITFFTGLGTLRILILSLAITPIRKLTPRLAWLIRFRRMLGLYAFFYGTLHLATYVILFSGLNWTLIADDLKKRRYIWAGFTSWTLMLPLALTSTTWSIRKLGGKRWQWLHRLVYLSAFAGIAHFWWLLKPGVQSPLRITIIFWLLLGARPVLSWLDARRKRALVPRAPLPGTS